MPVEVKRFKCQGYSCNHIKASRDSILRHEKNCWKNPANKTCKTCVHSWTEMFTNDDGELVDEKRLCTHGQMGNALTSSIRSSSSNMAGKLESPRINCPYWLDSRDFLLWHAKVKEGGGYTSIVYYKAKRTQKGIKYEDRGKMHLLEHDMMSGMVSSDGKCVEMFFLQPSFPDGVEKSIHMLKDFAAKNLGWTFEQDSVSLK